MPEDHPLQACLDELRGSEHPAPVHRVADRHAAALLGTPGVALALVAGARDSQDPERVLRLQLYEALIGQACTDLDNRGRVGRRFLDEACMAIERLVASETQLADEREALLWGFVNMLHSQVARLDRTVDKIVPEMRDLETAQDGTEVKAWELQLQTDRAQNLGDRRDAFETMRDIAAEAYRVNTGNTWRPRHGSHASQTGQLTSAAIDARDFRRARKDRETRAHLPEGTLVAITGGKQVVDADAVWTTLDRAREKYGDMILLHGGGPGVEKIAASWAEARGVHQVVCRPDWNAHGKAAPFRRNDELLNLLPKGVIAFPGSGITGNLVDKARQLGIPVHSVAA